MNVPARIVGFVAVLAAVFGLALALGNVVGPLDEPAVAAHDEGHAHDDGGHTETATSAELPGGLMVSENGYTLKLADAALEAGKAKQVDFVIEGPDGRPVTSYDEEHEKDLHLIVVRRDFTGFQHVHPTLDREGTWSVPVDLAPGAWRVFADFKPAGADAITLGSDLAVAGPASPPADLPANRTATVDGYTVTLTGDLIAGEHSNVTFSITRRGEPVTDLQPYLGAYGHLVALREGDLAYLHVHPGGEPGDGTTPSGPDVDFGAEVPTRSGYHLYLDFKHDGVVRTAQFAVDLGAER